MWFKLLYAQNVQFVPVVKGGSCCCGQFVELFYSNLDFEDAPTPPPGGLIVYSVGEFFSGWTCTRATIDHKDALFGNLTLGNPNGRSNFIDLHGSPGFGAIQYVLTGLTPGNVYRVDFWTAQNGTGYTSTGTLKIAGGAWLNVNWVVSQDGSAFWFKESHQFMATASSATMEFSSVGGSEWGGTLIDDIKIFECPGDMEFPEVNNPQDDMEVECDSDVPKKAILNVSDNCDPSPDVVFKETFEMIDPCTKIIKRVWEVKDDCGNVTTEEQFITVSDKNPPSFTKLPQDKFVYCHDDVSKAFNDWIKKNGDAIATDACGKVNWRTTIEHIPSKSCDSSLVEFIAIDHCGLEHSEFATFYVIDTSAPTILKPAEDKTFSCDPNAMDSLRSWLSNNGFAEAKDACDTTLWHNSFDGDTSKNDIGVWFYAKDLCGNTDSTYASFKRRSSSDTFRVFINSCTIPQDKMDTLKFTVNACDSIVIVHSTRIPSDTTVMQQNTCDPAQKKFDSIFLKNVFGCDSLVVQEYVLHPVQKSVIKDSTCSILVLFADTLHFMGQFCDSIIIHEHHPLRSDSTFIVKTSCDSTQRGTVINSLKNQFACDSIVSITTKYSAQSMTLATSKECGLKNYYVDTMKFAATFCDSIVITEHLPLRIDSVFIQMHTCDPMQSGITTSNLINILGCDSIVVTNRILDPRDSIYFTKFSCLSGDTGIVKQNLINQFGCDSIVVEETFLLPSDSVHIDKFSCKVNEVGRGSQLLQNQFGCDSIIITDTHLIPGDSIHIQAFTCQLNQTGTSTVVLKNQAGCDSTVVTQTFFIASDTTYLSFKTCLQSEVGRDSMLLRNNLGCDSLIFIEKYFVPLVLNYQLDSITCFNKHDGVFEILNSQDFSNPMDLILNNQVLTNLSALSNLSAGNYSLFIRDGKGCITDTVTFTLVNPQELITDLGKDLEVSKGSKVELNLQSNRNLKLINWFPANLSSCNNCIKIDLIADHDIWVYTLALDDRNCESSDSILIRVKKSGFVFAPNAISPNGDNVNDFFYLVADEQALIEILQIYDRWGEKVFETQSIPPNKPEFGWNGTFNAQKMNPGVFVYYAKVKLGDGTEQILKGDFTLIR